MPQVRVFLVPLGLVLGLQVASVGAEPPGNGANPTPPTAAKPTPLPSATKPTPAAPAAADAAGTAPGKRAKKKHRAGAQAAAEPAPATPSTTRDQPAKPKTSATATPAKSTGALIEAADPTPRAAPPAAGPLPVAAPRPQPAAAPAGPTCSLAEAEQPRGGRLDVLGNGFGQAPVVRIAAKPARMLERRSDRISVQVPPDSDGGPVTLQSEAHTTKCGTLVIIGKNR
jgi:hypothetical protein